MIDLAEAAFEFFEHKIWDVSLDTATLHIGEN
jgi:kynurenine 3-monooxygenase